MVYFSVYATSIVSCLSDGWPSVGYIYAFVAVCSGWATAYDRPLVASLSVTVLCVWVALMLLLLLLLCCWPIWRTRVIYADASVTAHRFTLNTDVRATAIHCIYLWFVVCLHRYLFCGCRAGNYGDNPNQCKNTMTHQAVLFNQFHCHCNLQMKLSCICLYHSQLIGDGQPWHVNTSLHCSEHVHGMKEEKIIISWSATTSCTFRRTIYSLYIRIDR